MNLYYVRAVYKDGDVVNLDLFCVAANALFAGRMWLAHFKGWDMPEHIKVTECPVPLHKTQGAVAWDTLNETKFPISVLVS